MKKIHAGDLSLVRTPARQADQLNDEQTALSVQQTRLIDAATLIGDLGGGWSDQQLHDPQASEPAESSAN